ncbi:hypothetical protein HPB50_008715 [Hyalomma asiaticum]|uniref:Uncharacterized protein n=1 Tax=Hyalomma asiaticum TaxID=266040 RepID=A0ACB7TGU2_HYAAI|nr:hypothetical protein HPB50_008715 [Hyalomma asiaticum]
MDLSKLPKPDLILMCKELGVNIAQISRKPQIVQAIEAIGAEEDELRECWELIESNKKKEVEEKELKRQASERFDETPSVAASLFKRALRLCLDDSARRREYAKVKHDLTGNGYPRQLLRQQELRSGEPPGNKPSDRKKTAPFPYAPGVSETLARILKSYNVQVARN